MHHDSTDPVAWTIINFIGLPKVRNACRLQQFRWIGKLSCFMKWYLQSLRPTYLTQTRPCGVQTYGFKPQRRTSDVTALIKEVLHHSYTWGRPLFVSSQDVETAFDSMPHEHVANAMLNRGLHAGSALSLMRELFKCQG